MERIIDKKEFETTRIINQIKPLVAILRKIKTKLSLHQLPGISHQNTNRIQQETCQISFGSGLTFVPKELMRPQRNTTMPYLQNGRNSNLMLLLEKEQNNKTLDLSKQEQKIPQIKQLLKRKESKVQKKKSSLSKIKLLRLNSQNGSLKKIQVNSQHKLPNQKMKVCQYQITNLFSLKENKNSQIRVSRGKEKPQLKLLKVSGCAQKSKQLSQQQSGKQLSIKRKLIRQKSINREIEDSCLELTQLTNIKHHSQHKKKQIRQVVQKEGQIKRVEKNKQKENKIHNFNKCRTMISEKVKNQDLSCWEIQQQEEYLLEKIMFNGKK